MSRYIDVDKVLEKYSEDGNWDLHKVLKGEPPSDVRENVHGEWIDTGSGQECSVCKEVQYGYDNFRNFCPWCGADMRKGAKE